MSVISRAFVALVFIIMGVSFIATTALLYWEFKDAQWLDFAIIYSPLFLFFPTFGIIALVAFYLPACLFMDMYWKHVPFGKIRLLLGGILMAALSYFIALQLEKGNVPDMWGLSPAVLKADRGGQISGCDSSKQSCRFIPLLDAVSELRDKSQRRFGISKFVRECNPDPLVEVPQALLDKRYCFVTKTRLNAADCCLAQKSFAESLAKKFENPANRSKTVVINYMLIPLKVFFLLIVLVIGVFLAVWRESVDRNYSTYIKYMERGLLVGAVAMLLWPTTNHAFLQSRAVILGDFADGIYAYLAPLFSVLFGAWALALLFFFFRRLEKDVEAIGKIAGLIGSAIAIIKYDQIIDYSVRVAGSGADKVTIGLLAIMGIFFLMTVLLGKPREVEEEKNDTS